MPQLRQRLSRWGCKPRRPACGRGDAARSATLASDTITKTKRSVPWEVGISGYLSDVDVIGIPQLDASVRGATKELRANERTAH